MQSDGNSSNMFLTMLSQMGIRVEIEKGCPKAGDDVLFGRSEYDSWTIRVFCRNRVMESFVFHYHVDGSMSEVRAFQSLVSDATAYKLGDSLEIYCQEYGHSQNDIAALIERKRIEKNYYQLLNLLGNCRLQEVIELCLLNWE